MIADDQYYSIKEVASFLKVGDAAVGKYLRSGTMEGKQVGPKNKWQVLGSEIKRIMKDWNMM
jgi:predicted transcriptional regulator